MLKLKLQYFDHLMQRADSLEKTLMLGKIEGGEEKGTTEDEMVGWHQRLNAHEFEQAPGVGDGQGGAVCFQFSPFLSIRQHSRGPYRKFYPDGLF